MTPDEQPAPRPGGRFDLSDLGNLRLPPETRKRGAAVLSIVATLLLIGAASAVAYSMAMRLPLSHDEHQFVAGGWLLGKYGMLPYRDFPFHHLPNLLFFYAALGLLSPAPLWNARVLSVVFTAATFALMFQYARRGDRGAGGWAMGGVASCVLLFSPLFEYTSGRAWNHALPTLLSVAAFVVHVRAASQPFRLRGWVWSGTLLALAVGARATYVLAAVPFLAFILSSQPRGFRFRPTGAFVVGLMVGLLPSAALFGLAPRQFAYGNLIYQILNTRYRQALGITGAMNLPGKLVYLREDVLSEPAQSLLFGSFLIVVAAAALLSRRRPRAPSREFWLASGVAAFLGLSAFAPTPAFVQYFYAPVPFIALALAIYLVKPGPGFPVGKLLAGLLVAAMVLLRIEVLRGIRLIFEPEAWVPAQVHALGVAISERTGEGRLLTLAPIVAVEGGLEIYPELVGGSFDWRVARSFSSDRRAVYGVMAPEDLEAALANRPPAGILVGFELKNEGFSANEMGGLERSLEAVADLHGYRLVAIDSPVVTTGLTLWVAPD
ncbi:MAG: glycosyltransferase family 39 protein [Anaerolineales bacterium]